ncbi:hypothetical protein EUX98_g6221 [Antrodiella citrinella]|uniref:Dihydrolipoamide acetyltransferase component of pyruvate dehydrogenase complex n=1 Tax=Antrodiella citrinella TaxID=2447956 RepID=A0A4S4MS63_9APHY|nr:hypothetical protein EUX98_g6221 [Antrodiella citrinella]
MPTATIQAFDALCEVQSDKASVEITSPFDGVIKELLVKEGEVAKVGSGLCIIEVDEEVAEALDDSPASPPPHKEQDAVQSGASTLPSQAAGVQDVSSPSPRKSKPHPLDPNVERVEPPVSLGGAAENVLAAPSVRHLARHSNVDLAKLVPGSGKSGRIMRKDVEDHIAGVSSTASTSESFLGGTADVGQDVVVDLSRTRHGMWKAMVKSLEIPHFGYSTSLDLTALNEILLTLNAHVPLHYLLPSSASSTPPVVSPAAFCGAPTPIQVPPTGQFVKLTYLPILLKTLSKAMSEWPLFRSSITPTSETTSDKPTLTLRPNADISVALSTPSGLYTPTLQRVNAHSIYSLASQLKHISHLGRQGRLTPAEMPKRGGTVTVSNIGGIGDGEGASPVLVPGTGIAIVAIGRAKWVWDVNRGDGSGERRLKVSVAWSADHRVVEGAELVAFVETWRSWVENPQRLIAEGI